MVACINCSPIGRVHWVMLCNPPYSLALCSRSLTGERGEYKHAMSLCSVASSVYHFFFANAHPVLMGNVLASYVLADSHKHLAPCALQHSNRVRP